MLLFDGADMPGARLFGQGGYITGIRDVSVDMHGLNHIRVELRAFQVDDGVMSNWMNLPFTAIEVMGGGAVDTARMVYYGNTYGGDRNMPEERIIDVQNDGRMLVVDTWGEDDARYFMHLTGSGEITVNGSTPTANGSDPVLIGTPSTFFDGFTGLATFISVVDTRYGKIGAGTTPNVLALGVSSTIASATTPWLQTGDYQYACIGQNGFIPDEGAFDPASDSNALADASK